MKLSLVVPVYRGQAFLPPLAKRVAAALPAFSEDFEVIFVCDGSPDESWAAIEALTQRHEWARGIRLMRNYGQHNATLCGVRAARHEVIVTLDQDLQHPPEEIPALLAKLNEGFDVVYGAPKKLPQGWLRNLLTVRTKNMLARVIGAPALQNISAFRAFRASLRPAFDDFHSPTVILDVLLSWGTSRFTAVQVNIAAAERSNYTFRTLVKAALLILTGYSTLPLRFASWLGFMMTAFGAGIFVYVTYVYFALGSLPGFPFLASVIALFSGAQMFTLGIFGEYLARIFDRSMGRPAYVIHETAGK